MYICINLFVYLSSRMERLRGFSQKFYEGSGKMKRAESVFIVGARYASPVLWLLMLISGPSYAQDIYIHPDRVDASVGGLFAVDVMVRNVADLSTFEFRISFDKDILEAVSAIRGSLWDDPDHLWHAGEIDNTSGIIGFTSGAAYSDSSPVGVSVDANGGVLATITFQAISAGTSPVGLTDVLMYCVSGDEISVNAVNGIVSVIADGQSSTSVVLRESNSGSSTFTVNEGDTFDLQVWIDAGTEPVSSVAAYLTFDDKCLQLAGDEYPDISGIQPFEQGTFIGAGSENWIVNEIDPDEPDEIPGIQLDYSEGKLAGSTTGLGLLATVTFVALGSAPAYAGGPRTTTVTFDFDLPNARATEIGIVGPPYTVTPDSHTDAQITINALPSVSDLSISPKSPSTMDDLLGSYTYSDPEGDPESASEIRWYKDGGLQSDYNDILTVPSSATSKGQVWHFTVRPNDGTSFGELQTSDSVTVYNTLPVASDLSITPASPKVGDDLVGSYDYSDADGDLENGSETRWYKDSVLQPDYSDTLTVPSSAASKGQVWHFTVRPSDGTSFGELQTSDSVTVYNTLPVASDLSITPASPRAGDDLVGNYDYSDADGDLESGSKIRWYKDSVLQSDHSDTLAVPSTATSKGQEWYFTVRPSDGKDYGTLQTSPIVRIKNSPPSAKAGGPYKGAVDAAVTFTSAGSSDVDNDTLTYVWDFDHRDGTDDVDSSEPSPVYVYTEPGVYTATLTVNDGTADSSPSTTTADIKVEINGSVALQGYSDSLAVTISLRPVGTTTELETFDFVTNDGSFTILTPMELGTYDIAAKSEKYLRAIARGVSISGGLEDVIFDPEIPGIPAGELRGGDCDGDNAVSLEDFSILAYYYNQTTDAADINGDGRVDLLDFVILGSNFGFVGVDGRVPASPGASPVSGDGDNGNLRFCVYVDKDTRVMNPGDEFDAHVRIDDANHLRGYSIRLEYDHHALQIVEQGEGFNPSPTQSGIGGLVKEGAFLKSNPGGRPTLLVSKACEVPAYAGISRLESGVQNSTGKMMLSSYITGPNADGVSGSGIVATLRFRLIGSSPGVISIYEPVVTDDHGRINTLPMEEFALQILPQRTSLLMNYPNPLNPETWIPYELAEASDVRIEIYSLTGQLTRILDLGYRQPGFYTRRGNAAHWDGRNGMGEEVASGVYFYTIRAGNFLATRKMTVLR
jgi:PKD repeat protein